MRPIYSEKPHQNDSGHVQYRSSVWKVGFGQVQQTQPTNKSKNSQIMNQIQSTAAVEIVYGMAKYRKTKEKASSKDSK